MKLFTLIGLITFAALGGCGNAEELKAAQSKVEALQKENATLKVAVNELNSNLGVATAERDDLKSKLEKATAPAAAPAPAPAAKPKAKSGKHK